MRSFSFSLAANDHILAEFICLLTETLWLNKWLNDSSINFWISLFFIFCQMFAIFDDFSKFKSWWMSHPLSHNWSVKTAQVIFNKVVGAKLVKSYTLHYYHCATFPLFAIRWCCRVHWFWRDTWHENAEYWQKPYKIVISWAFQLIGALVQGCELLS